MVPPLLGWGVPVHARPSLQATQESSASQKALHGAEITLSLARPTARLPLDPVNLAGSSPHLAITLARITNPNHAAFSVVVSLEPKVRIDGKGSGLSNAAAGLPIVLGDLGVYPSDQPGRYQLNIPSSVLQRLRVSGQGTTHLRLRLTLKRLHADQPAPDLEVVLSQPEWTHGAQ